MGCLQRAFSASQEEFRDCVGDIDSIHPPAQWARTRFQGEKREEDKNSEKGQPLKELQNNTCSLYTF